MKGNTYGKNKKKKHCVYLDSILYVFRFSGNENAQKETKRETNEAVGPGLTTS